MKILLDTNILIAAEPTAVDEIEPTTESVVILLNAIQRCKYEIYIHPASRIDINNDNNERRKMARMVLLEKYNELKKPPAITDDFRYLVYPDTKDPVDSVDDYLLAAVYRDAVDFLVTEDRGIHTKAQRLEIHNRVLTLDAILRTIRGLIPVDIEPPPAVESIICYQLSENDPIFNTFREDYPEFDMWLTKCKREHRSAWIIGDSYKKYVGMTIVKDEKDQPYGLSGRVLKICSFKIADSGFGKGFSELLLKTIFDFAFIKRYDYTYVEVLPKYGGLIHFFYLFGFEESEQFTKRGELVLVKVLTFSKEDYQSMSPINFHIKFGPKYYKIDGVQAYIVPIRPQYHELLFPEKQVQLPLLPGLHAFGNAIRKAYLCNSPIKIIPQGSVLLFYRTEDIKAVQCIGVVEKAIRSDDPVIIERFVGPRTVYTSEDIKSLCVNEVLAINFRCAQPLDTAFPLDQLRKASIIKGPPQSIVALSEGGLNWLREKIRK